MENNIKARVKEAKKENEKAGSVQAYKKKKGTYCNGFINLFFKISI